MSEASAFLPSANWARNAFEPERAMVPRFCTNSSAGHADPGVGNRHRVRLLVGGHTNLRFHLVVDGHPGRTIW